MAYGKNRIFSGTKCNVQRKGNLGVNGNQLGVMRLHGTNLSDAKFY